MMAEYRCLLKALADEFGDRLRTVVLFGSRARGEARPESDHDIFIIVEGLPEEPLERSRQVRKALLPVLADLPGAINFHAKTPSEFEGDLTPLFLDVIVDGVCLLGRDYFEPLRRKGLAALASSGMERKRVGGSLFWVLPGNVPRDWELTWEGYRERP